MPKISSLPPMTTPDGADELPIVDTGGSTTRKITLTSLKEWLQSLTAWITPSMVENPYKFHAYRSSAYDNPNSARVPLNAVLFDTNSDFDTANYEYVAPVDGYYQFSFQVRSESISGTGYHCYLYKDGTTVVAFSSGFISGFTNTGGWNSVGGSQIVYLTAGEAVALYFVGSGTTSNNTLSVQSHSTFFSGYLVSET